MYGMFGMTERRNQREVRFPDKSMENPESQVRMRLAYFQHGIELFILIVQDIFSKRNKSCNT